MSLHLHYVLEKTRALLWHRSCSLVAKRPGDGVAERALVHLDPTAQVFQVMFTLKTYPHVTHNGGAGRDRTDDLLVANQTL